MNISMFYLEFHLFMTQENHKVMEYLQVWLFFFKFQIFLKFFIVIIACNYFYNSIKN